MADVRALTGFASWQEYREAVTNIPALIKTRALRTRGPQELEEAKRAEAGAELRHVLVGVGWG